MLSKKDLKCIGEFIHSGYPKVELNFALVGRGGICATDTRKAIKFHNAELNGEEILVHKKLLKGFESTMDKNDEAVIVKLGETEREPCIRCGSIEMALSTANFDHKFPDIDKQLDKKLDFHFRLNSLVDIQFELAERNCFMDSMHLNPLVSHSGMDWFDVFYTPMAEKDMGMVKIIATKVIDEEEVVYYTAVIMSREFKSQAK